MKYFFFPVIAGSELAALVLFLLSERAFTDVAILMLYTIWALVAALLVHLLARP